MGYVETLFGHQDSIGCIDAFLEGSRGVSTRFFRGGGRSRLREVLEGGLDEEEEANADESTKAAKRNEAKSFIEGSIDCVAMVDENTFVSGGDSGTIALWITQKKKPVYTVPLAHGLEQHHSETEGIIETPYWITSLACLPYSDVMVSGSWDGRIRIWKLELSNARDRRISGIGGLEAPGVVNSLQLIRAPNGQEAEWARAGKIVCVAGGGGEMRSGRWVRVEAGSFGYVYVI